jgi:hypothetical protein
LIWLYMFEFIAYSKKCCEPFTPATPVQIRLGTPIKSTGYIP